MSHEDLIKKKRDDDLVCMRKQGHTFAEIGKSFGISRSRAEQICRKVEVIKRNEEESEKLKAETGEETLYGLGATARVRNALWYEGIKTKEDLMKKLQEGFLVRNIGEKSIKELEGITQRKIKWEYVKIKSFYFDEYYTKRFLKFEDE